jgi:hypothetical protein
MSKKDFDMRDFIQDPSDEISSAGALASALAYLYAEAQLARLDFVAHLILVAIAAIDEELGNEGEESFSARLERTRVAPKLRLVEGCLDSAAETRADADDEEDKGS